MNKPDTFCFAPWTHTYLSPQTERRMCCASREPAQNFQQYIDTSSGTGKYIPITLDEHWNGPHMRDVRKRMLAGETLPECEVCNDRLLNVSVYRDYFSHLFGHLWDEVLSSTAEDGTTTMKVRSWDYRFNNLCNFKCRTCGDMLSSSWESEQRIHGMIDWNNPKNNWMRSDIKPQIEQFQTTQVEQEFAQAVEEHRVEEIYWVGGEPLMYEQHWRYMKRIVELGDGGDLYARYNTNLSRIYHNGIDLYEDILKHVRDWQICASLDGTGEIGEYIRTGLDYRRWLANYRRGLEVRRYSRQMRIDFTLTLPGMFEIGNIIQLSKDLDSEILAKVMFSFSPDIVMSPLALPRPILESWINQLLRESQDSASITELLKQIQSRPTFEEQWPDQYRAAIKRGKNRILELEKIRLNPLTMDKILSARPDVYTWWQNI